MRRSRLAMIAIRMPNIYLYTISKLGKNDLTSAGHAALGRPSS
jgi:hypothetical protein